MSNSSGFDLNALCAFPAQQPPHGQVPDFEDPVSLRLTIEIVGGIMTALSVMVTISRLYVNWRKLHLADYCGVIGAAIIISYTMLIISFGQYHRHQWDVPACWFNGRYVKFLFVSMTIFGPGVFFAKAAIFFMYLQFFSIRKSLRIAVYIGLVVTACTYIPSIAVAAFFGAPRPGETWDSMITNKRLLHESTYGVVQGAIAVITDIYIFLIPISVLRSLKLGRSKRIQLLSLFGTALIAVAASIVALIFRLRLHSPGGKVIDTTWNQACTSIAVIIENNVAIIIGAMPAFASLLRRHFGNSHIFTQLRHGIRRGSGSVSSWWKEGSSRTSLSSNDSTKEKNAAEKSPSRSPDDYAEAFEGGAERSQPVAYGGISTRKNSEAGIMRSVKIVQQSQSRDASTLV